MDESVSSKCWKHSNKFYFEKETKIPGGNKIPAKQRCRCSVWGMSRTDFQNMESGGTWKLMVKWWFYFPVVSWTPSCCWRGSTRSPPRCRRCSWCRGRPSRGSLQQHHRSHCCGLTAVCSPHMSPHSDRARVTRRTNDETWTWHHLWSLDL